MDEDELHGMRDVSFVALSSLGIQGYDLDSSGNYIYGPINWALFLDLFLGRFRFSVDKYTCHQLWKDHPSLSMIGMPKSERHGLYNGVCAISKLLWLDL